MGLMDKLNAKVKEFQLKSLEKQEEVTRKALDDQDNSTCFLADIQTKTLKHQITQQQKIRRQLTGNTESDSDSSDDDRYKELMTRIKSGEQLTDTEFNEFTDLDYKNHQAKTEEFKTGSHDIFEDNDLSLEETTFFKAFVNVASQRGYNPHLFRLNRLGNKILNVRYVNYQIGRIKLVGNKTKVQILTDLENVEWIEDRSLAYYIEQLPRWFDYLDLITDDLD